jgi:hypothetical protein
MGPATPPGCDCSGPPRPLPSWPFGALVWARASHVQARRGTAADGLPKVTPGNPCADRVLAIGGALNVALFGLTYWLAWATRFGETGPDFRSMGWAMLAASLLILGSGLALLSLRMRPPAGPLRRAFVLPVLVVGAFAALFSWTLVVVGPLE